MFVKDSAMNDGTEMEAVSGEPIAGTTETFQFHGGTEQAGRIVDVFMVGTDLVANLIVGESQHGVRQIGHGQLASLWVVTGGWYEREVAA